MLINETASQGLLAVFIKRTGGNRMKSDVTDHYAIWPKKTEAYFANLRMNEDTIKSGWPHTLLNYVAVAKKVLSVLGSLIIS